MARSLPITEQISALFDREETGHRPPYGKVLDLGCGSGIWAVKLAARGGPLPRGAGREDIEAAFSGWKVINEEAVDVSGAPRYVSRADPRFYRLRLRRRPEEGLSGQSGSTS